jgi:hypothetical protein
VREFTGSRPLPGAEDSVEGNEKTAVEEEP